MGCPYVRKSMKAVVFTLGCKVNSCESASLITGLENLGYEVSDSLEYADLYVINTCAVTAEAEKKSRQAIARVRKFNENATVIVTGCAAEKNAKSFFDKEGVTLVTGAKRKENILKMLDKKGVFIEDEELNLQETLPPKTSKTRAYIKIQDGCDNFCSYCVIPYLRGRNRSRSIIGIKREIEYLLPLEVVLTGINVTAYNYEGNTVVDLIKAISDVNVRVRLGSLEENVISEEFLKALKGLKDFAPHFHLSLQSGSDKVLKEMNRKYTTEEFRNSVNLIKEYFPNSAVTTDIIVGYPTETEEDFLKTVEFAKSVEFSDIHCFPFSMREGTFASTLKDLPSSVKKERLDKLMLVKNDLKNAFISKNLGRIATFVSEEYDGEFTLGYTENYLRVYLPKKVENAIYKIRILKEYKDGVLAELVG